MSDPKEAIPKKTDKGVPARIQVEPPKAQNVSGIDHLLAGSLQGPDRVEVIRELVRLRQTIVTERAQAAIVEAVARLRAEAPLIVKDKGVPTRSGEIAYKYAPLEKIEVAIRPLEEKHGLAHRYDTAVEAGWVSVTCEVLHCNGGRLVSNVRLPIGTRTPLMSETQQYAAAITFAQRRALVAAYGLVIVGEDMDGALPRPLTGVGDAERRKALLRELWSLVPHEPGDKDWKKTNEFLARSRLATKPVAAMSEDEIEATIDRLKSKAKGEENGHERS